MNGNNMQALMYFSRNQSFSVFSIHFWRVPWSMPICKWITRLFIFYRRSGLYNRDYSLFRSSCRCVFFLLKLWRGQNVHDVADWSLIHAKTAVLILLSPSRHSVSSVSSFGEKGHDAVLVQDWNFISYICIQSDCAPFPSFIQATYCYN